MKKEDFIDYFIKTSWHSLSRLYNSKAQKHGITTSIAFVLLNISSSEGTPATKIAPTIGLETRSLTRILRKLEEDGFIYRAKDLNDKRSVRVFLTEKGKEKKGEAIKTVKAFNEFIKRSIGKKDLMTYARVSRKIIELVEHDQDLRTLIEKG
jgi:DNA-binding MarR family transcriptional regulator